MPRGKISNCEVEGWGNFFRDIDFTNSPTHLIKEMDVMCKFGKKGPGGNKGSIFLIFPSLNTYTTTDCGWIGKKLGLADLIFGKDTDYRVVLGVGAFSYNDLRTQWNGRASACLFRNSLGFRI